MNIDDGAVLVANELRRAINKHGPHKSLHEGYAILLEEVDELWYEIKHKNPIYTMVHTEAVQVAAMALEIALATAPDAEGIK